MSVKVNLVQEHRAEYATPASPQLITVGPGTYLSSRGEGAPDGETFARKLTALYGVVYTIKMAGKRAEHDFAMAPLEGLWWVNKNGEQYLQVPRSQWQWKLLIRVPTFVTNPDLDAAIGTLHRKGKGDEVAEIHLEEFEEGSCVQMLHIGPYTTEPQTLEQMSAFVAAQGLNYHGLHHEIYLSDPRRTGPERLRTILRHPVHS
jgi:hypothetical protein